MRARAVTWSGVVLAGLLCGCGGRPDILVPPRLDLKQYGKVGLVTFTVENAKGSLHQYATERFAEGVLAAQPGVEVLEFGSMDTLVQRVGEPDLGIASAEAIGNPRCTPWRGLPATARTFMTSPMATISWWARPWASPQARAGTMQPGGAPRTWPPSSRTS
jgi:hypothetical protein